LHAHDHHDLNERRTRVLWISLIANAGFMAVEVVGGIAFHSLALLADAGHMLSDVAGLAIALVAQRLLSRPASSRHSFGLQRAEVLGALANGVILLAVAAWITWEAIGRLGAPPEVEGMGMMVVASIGLAVNLGSALLLARAAGRSVNMRGAVLHMGVDAAGSVAAMVAALGVLVWRANWLDPVVSLLVVGLVVWSVWKLLTETVHVLLEGTPRDIDLEEVERALQGDNFVEGVHHLHVWSLASEVPALSAHVVLSSDFTLHDAQVQSDRLRRSLSERFGINHATLELECHSCEAPETGH
jgi:cobalt-zinc-cadmium efflux system protein